MKKKTVFTSLFRWLASTEMFARPSKQLPGKWKLFEFYTEPGGELINRNEEQLNAAGFYWVINFDKQGKLHQEMNLPVEFLKKTAKCKWETVRNFVALSPLEIPHIKEEFQFAIDKNYLKLLKKDVDGRIEFFGFFRKVEKE